MAVITLQFGQCGNQMGYELFSLIYKDLQVTNHGVSGKQNKDYMAVSGDKFFRTSSDREENLIARSVLVDTEKKVVRNVIRDTSNVKLTYDPNNIIAGQGGSANNWAYGHYHKGPGLSEQAMDVIRKEAERCDGIYTFLGLLSSAGGTGSGVGSYILECVRDEYPRKTLAEVVVLPFSKGEVAIQSYNTLFTLSNVHSHSDSIIILRNDYLFSMCQFQLNIKNANLSDMNSLGMKQLSTLLLCKGDISGVLMDLTPHPGYKFISLDSAPNVPHDSLNYESAVAWKALASEAKRVIQVKRLSEQKPLRMATIANAIVTRGPGSEPNCVFDQFKKIVYFPNWIPSDSQINTYHQDRRFLNFDKYFTWSTNSSDICLPLKCNIEKAIKLYSYRAYVHQYKAHGVKDEDFMEAFTKTQSLLKSYQDIIIE